MGAEIQKNRGRPLPSREVNRGSRDKPVGRQCERAGARGRVRARAEGASCRRAPGPSVGEWHWSGPRAGGQQGETSAPLSVSGDAPGGWATSPSKPVGPSGPIREWKTAGLTSGHTQGWMGLEEGGGAVAQRAAGTQVPPCCQQLPLPLLLISTPPQVPPRAAPQAVRGAPADHPACCLSPLSRSSSP